MGSRSVYLRHFQHYFSYIVAVNFTVRGNRSTRRKQTTDLLQVTDKFNHVIEAFIDVVDVNTTLLFYLDQLIYFVMTN
jgi:hypothetical protein